MADIRKPKRLPDGGTIAFTAPASTPDPLKLEGGIRYFEEKGYRVVVGESCRATDFYFAGPAADRADELHRFFEDDSIDAIFCVRGGFGCLSLLPLLDYDLISAHPKLFLGFSDITILQSALFVKSGLPGISGALPAVDFYSDPDPQTEKWFWDFLKSGKIELTFPNTRKNSSLSETATGISLPGTLSLFSKLAGTPYLPGAKGKVLILEDVEEPVHKTEGYLTHLMYSGWIPSAEGIVFGDFAPAEKESYPEVPALDQVFARVLRNCRAPWATGVPYGHIKRRISLPFGTGLSVSFGRFITLHSTESFFAD